MSTVHLFAPPQPYAEIERQRDEFQLRAAEYRLALEEVQKFFHRDRIFYSLTLEGIVPEGWIDMRKKVDEVLR